jgi:ATP-dependent protease ClpP protease subunit
MRHVRATLNALLVIGFLASLPITAFGATLPTESEVYEIDEDTSPGTTEHRVADSFDVASLNRTPLASYGPFHVISPNRVELIGSIESETPDRFRALLRAYPAVKQIDMIECPGTGDDEANLILARMIRNAGLSTYVPNGGSVRSGGVELFLAGLKRKADPGAEFAVHSWRDEDGFEADDYASDDPAHQAYIAYYREMGMSDAKARAFYQMTNSAPHDDALYLKASDIAAYLPLS